MELVNSLTCSRLSEIRDPRLIVNLSFPIWKFRELEQMMYINKNIHSAFVFSKFFGHPILYSQEDREPLLYLL